MALSPPFILIVDDDAEFGSLQQQLLEERGFEASAVTSGKEALEYGVVLMLEGAVAVVDMIMPMMDGVAAIEVLRWHYPNLRFVASSGHSESLFREKLDRLGVKTFLGKPYAADVLVQKVKEASAEAEGPLPVAPEGKPAPAEG